MKKTPNWLIIFIILSLIISSKFIFFSKKEEKQQAGKDKKNNPIAVNYYVVKADTLHHIVFATGRMGALNQVDIIPEVNGKITAIYFKEGETVDKGALLIKLNDADLQAQLLKTKTQLNLSEQKLERLKKLLNINGVSQEEYDMQENERKTLLADEAFILAQISKTTLVAPFAGVVGLKDVSEGSFVNTVKPIVSLVQLKPLYLEFSIPEKYSHLLSKGMEIRFYNENIKTGDFFKASVYAIEPKVDEFTKTIKARALYSGSETFYPGSYMKVEVNLGKTNNALMLPSECLIATLKGQKVFLYKKGIASEALIEIGIRTEKMIQVSSGLQAGDTVISSGLLSIRKDAQVTLIKVAK